MDSKDSNFYIQGVLNNDRRVIAKTITLIESSLKVHMNLAGEILNGLLPHAGKAIRLGITGVPGVGKSTFIESFGFNLIKKNHKIAVLAVDPSSSRSGGSILGDKTRMEKLSVEENAFIRPSPSSGTLGGVAKKTRETMLVCEAAGYDVIIVETVGVGQSETAVSSMVDFFMVLMLAGAGDELQGIKKGILEIADTIVINKADGDNVKNAERARQEYETALHFLNPSSKIWSPPVLTSSALKEEGINKIWETILSYRDKMSESGDFELKRKKQSLDWMWSLVEDGLRDRFFDNKRVKENLEKITNSVEGGSVAATIAANELLSFLDK